MNLIPQRSILGVCVRVRGLGGRRQFSDWILLHFISTSSASGDTTNNDIDNNTDRPNINNINNDYNNIDSNTNNRNTTTTLLLLLPGFLRPPNYRLFLRLITTVVYSICKLQAKRAASKRNQLTKDVLPANPHSKRGRKLLQQ